MDCTDCCVENRLGGKKRDLLGIIAITRVGGNDGGLDSVGTEKPTVTDKEGKTKSRL